ncbi:MAG: septation protein SpoVG family protein [FCB group bacterium]|nr:septation protein SpoVG family protein [FCB group bacterium]
MKITEIKIRLAAKDEPQLIGFASLVLDGNLYLNNIAIRRKPDGTIYLSFPRYRTGGGNEYPYFKPISKGSYDEIKQALIQSFRMEKNHD